VCNDDFGLVSAVSMNESSSFRATYASTHEDDASRVLTGDETPPLDVAMVRQTGVNLASYAPVSAGFA
jgi:hypothetical protein